MTERDGSRAAPSAAALRDSEQRLRAIWETAVDGIITIDDHGCIESLNPAASRIFGYRPEEVIGRNVKVLMPTPYHEAHDGYLANYLRTGEAKIIGIGREVVGRRKDGSVFPMELAVAEVTLGDRRLFTGLVRDISQRRELEQAVAAAAEQERARIARELHDGLGQQLGGLLFLMKGLQRDLADDGSDHAATAGQLAEELATALTLARHLSHDLYSVPPEPDGLARALESLAGRITVERGVACVYTGQPSLLVPNPTVASHLYRIAQEAVHNALKHSRARRIDIELARGPSMLALSIRDDGAGFTAGADTRGLGLRTMEQRARLAGGRLMVQPRPGAGVEVACFVPVAALAAPPARTPEARR